MRVLVTGGAGFIGSTVVDRLLAHGHEVFVVDDLSSGRLANLDWARREGGVRFHRLDICSSGLRDLVARADPEVVCHLAAQVSVSRSVADPVHDARVNVVGLLNLLEVCVAAGVRKIVHTGSGGAMYGEQTVLPVPEDRQGRPASPYGISKRVAEDYLRFYRSEYGLTFTTLALSNVYGPRQDPHGEAGVVAIFSRKLVSSQPPTIFGTGEFTRDYVFVGDVAHAYVLALGAGDDETFNIGTSVETSVNELFRQMADISGFDREALTGPSRPGDVPRNCLDWSKARNLLGWEPWTPLADGLRETVDWFRREERDGQAGPTRPPDGWPPEDQPPEGSPSTGA